MKMPFDDLTAIVEEYYTFNPDIPESQVEEKCVEVADLLEVCGWTEDEYWREWMRRNEGVDSPPDPPYLTRRRLLQ
jgi:hypothetical protein